MLMVDIPISKNEKKIIENAWCDHHQYQIMKKDGHCTQSRYY